MKQSISLAAVATGALILAACGGGGTTTNDTAMVVPVDNGAGPAVVAPADGAGVPADAVALGLTESQLLDADLRDPSGTDIGDVEGVERDAGGTVTHLVVEVADTDPDRYVRVPLEGLERVPDGSDWDVRGPHTRAQLLEMPAIQR